MLESLHFFYDDISSIDMGVKNVNSSSSLFEEFFLPTRTIYEQTSLSREKPYFLKIRNEPISFSMTILFDDEINNNRMREIARWLFQDSYKPLKFSSNPNRIFYAIIEGDSSFIHNGLGQGYIEVNVRCDSPYAYTPEFIEEDVLQRTENTSNRFVVSREKFQEGIMRGTAYQDGEGVKVLKLAKWGEFPPNSKWGDIL